MSNEPLGIVAERQAIAAKYARFIAPPVRYIIPEEPAAPPPSVVAESIVIPPVLTVSTKGGCYSRPWGGGGKPVPNIGVVSGKARDIINVTCAVWQTDVESVVSVKRDWKNARPRQAAMSLMIKHLGISQTSIGRIFNRDHTTVASAKTKVFELLATDRSFRVRYAYATRKLRRLWSAL